MHVILEDDGMTACATWVTSLSRVASPTLVYLSRLDLGEVPKMVWMGRSL